MQLVQRIREGLAFLILGPITQIFFLSISTSFTIKKIPLGSTSLGMPFITDPFLLIIGKSGLLLMEGYIELV
jgi:hypothetical protein